jgi:predicted kinase
MVSREYSRKVRKQRVFRASPSINRNGLAPPVQPRAAVSENWLVPAATGPRLIIVCGLPGSGKTIHAKELEVKHRAVRLCPDEWMNALEINLYDAAARERVEALQWKLAQDLLLIGHTVIIEWGTWGRSERDALRLRARALAAAVELHFLDAPTDVLYERIQHRKLESPPIERDDVLKWAAMFERPTIEEMKLFDPPSI